ncbi:exodeoxyribonuclease V subunit gamma [Shewanella fidelis]|uniref:RecBCD enzyme subunit RecC n=1 Tax=Shewanella fidelis TaxID=173509 RepID=A0AAW8NLJ6_9GAMM|nr:exodeoxyribonuclease V subunit gamma [Shewanella fidelis]MDR8524083.1 exodeoxyribonuclease V subunit gamma [Shewanella fidelis]MDW4810630.1 exodeoxyribonuclease V subunit gamma [Shewanella fidelis]MDW4814751.1 exodeoxyribonuclease V subunit gamma [Shewanella fidelis]MDW4818841.1 exodeoxyribonuclease V subunit gamma [Shewanella fidelis]MDW4823482.1 exodeoxyribonuclease V subunit gamma [Shewanella fidelis]
MLYLVQSNQMEALSALLANELRTPLPNTPLLMPEHILVQSPGMSTWLRLEIAKQNNIAAGLEFPLPSSFIWQLCHTLLEDVPKENAFTKAAMTWKLMELLPSLIDHEDFLPLANYLNNGNPETEFTTELEGSPERTDSSEYTDSPEPTNTAETAHNPLKLYQLCGQIADIFDQYLVYRPDWINAWEALEPTLPPKGDKLSPAQAWQPILWRALIDFNANTLQKSQYHRANLHQALFDALDDPNTNLDALPRRLFVFGISSMAPQTLDVLHYLAKRIDVIMLNLSPCQHYWGDIVDPRLRARMALQYADKNKLELEWEDKLEVGNPLLANNGKMGRELLDLLLELPEEHTAFNFDCYQEPIPNNMLSGVQYDILQLSTRGQSLGPDAGLYLSLEGRRVISANDNSITLRSCHSPLREVETLHDHLLEMLSQVNPDGTAQFAPKDIVIMMPDVAAYAPYIDAVFGAKQGNHYIPYAIADRGAAQESPLISSFLQLLKINQSRFGLTDILSILEVPAVLRRFELDDDSLTVIKRWLDQAGVRWGRDENSRSEYQLPAFEQNSWAFGIKRLILGYSFSDNAPIYQHSLAVNGVEGQTAQALGKLLDFIEALDSVQQALAEVSELDQRMAQLESILDDFYEVDDDERVQQQEIRDAIAKLHLELTEAGHSTPLTIEVLQNWFNSRLSESRVGQRYLAGSVNFCTLMPMRSIPFKLVCLLGMNDGVYPRVQHPVGFDLVAQMGPRKGDRSRRLDDRYLFLEAILSAREQLYISYIGNSERDDSERIPSMLVSELIEYCQLVYLPEALEQHLDEPQIAPSLIDTIEHQIRHQLIIKQPLQPFDGRLYQAQLDGENSTKIQQSYAAQWCPTATNTDINVTAKKHYQGFIDANTQILPFIDEAASAATDADMPNVEELEVSALIRFYRNPAQYFFNRSLKVDLSLSIQADDNDEPFSLNALERYKLQAVLLDSAISRGEEKPNLELLERLKAQGNLPLKPFDDLLLNQYLHDIKPLIGRSLYLKGDASHSIDIELNFDELALKLVGRIDDISAKGLVNYRPGTANGRDLIRVYLRHLCLCAMKNDDSGSKPSMPMTSYLLDIGHFHAFASITAVQAKNQLTQWLSYFQQGQVHPIMFMPRTALAYVEAEGSHWQKLITAQTQWLDEQSQLGEGLEPHFQRLFTFPDDFTEDKFASIANQLLAPLLSLYHKDKLSELASFVEAGINAQGEVK